MSPQNLSKHSNDDCYFFINSQCVKGARCLYRHSEAAKTTAVICRFWLRGTCVNKNCKYRHSREHLTFLKKKYENGDEEERLYPLFDKTKIDKFAEEHEARLKKTDEDGGDDREKERIRIAKMIEKSYQRYNHYEFRPQFVKKKEKTNTLH